MAAVYTFDTIKSVNKPTKYLKDPDTVTKVQKALASKKIAKPHADKFITAYKAYNFSAVALEAQGYVQKNMVAQGLAPVGNANALEKAMMVALFGPQKLVLTAKFDLSVHLKGNNLEMQHTSCKGTSKVLFTVAP
jgi:hypothetical protein